MSRYLLKYPNNLPGYHYIPMKYPLNTGKVYTYLGIYNI